MPLSFISSIDVEYKGARRAMKITIPSDTGTNTFTTIIPEAYQISITLTSLVGESKNFMYAAAATPNNIAVYDISELPAQTLTAPTINAAEAIGAQQLQQQQKSLNNIVTGTLA